MMKKIHVRAKRFHVCGNFGIALLLTNYKISAHMKKILSIGLIFFFLFFGAGCSSRQGTHNVSKKTLTQKQLIDFNRRLLHREKRQIDAFIKAHHWKMKVTGTGLRYQWLKRGNGPLARTGQHATIRYEVQLFDGQRIYSGTKTFKIGFGGVESGLEEGILLMKRGDVARFILPSHLAYGLSGDGNKIPPHTPIIYRVELLNLK